MFVLIFDDFSYEFIYSTKYQPNYWMRPKIYSVAYTKMIRVVWKNRKLSEEKKK